jgi:hypothetical protein
VSAELPTRSVMALLNLGYGHHPKTAKAFHVDMKICMAPYFSVGVNAGTL